MASATRLNAASSIINNTGLSVSPDLSSAITVFQNHSPISSLANAYANSGISANVTANVVSILDTVGSGITQGWFLLDQYPPNVTPTASANIKSWSPSSKTATGDLITYNNRVFKTTGNTFSSAFDANVVNNCRLKGFSEVINLQANLPFKYTNTGFANVYYAVYSFILQGFDSTSSSSLFKNTKYSSTGVGYSGPTDLVTYGIGTDGRILANVVSNFGTMYDINNVSKFADPYVFGQYLLDQGFGPVNNMAGQFEALGLSTADITRIPQTSISQSQTVGTNTVNIAVGNMELPTIVESTQVNVATGTSPEMILAVFETVQGANLTAIISATNITLSQNSKNNIRTLRDFLDLEKVVSEENLSQLNSIGIKTFPQLSKYLADKTAPGRFANWVAMSNFFKKIEVPTLSHMPTGGNVSVLLPGTSTTISNTYGSGVGVFENPTINDFFGATEGNPYVAKFKILNDNYDAVAGTLGTTMRQLDQSVIDYCNAYNAYEATFDGNVYLGLEPSIGAITSNVTAINTYLGSILNDPALQACDRAVYQMLNKLSVEKNNLTLAHVNFDPATIEVRKSFAENIHQLASDKDQYESYQFFANIIANNIAGDTIRATIAEYINESVLATAGIRSFNDPDPGGKIREAKAQNLPITTYLSRNK